MIFWVAVYIMAIVYGVIVSTVQAQERIEEVTRSSEIGPAILSQVRQDLEAALLPKGDETYFVAYDRKGSGGDRDRVDLVTAVMAYGAEREGEDPVFQSVNEVGYQLRDSREDPAFGVLYRREDYFYDKEPTKGGRLVEMYDKVKHFNLLFWNGERWLEDWDNKREGGKLPQAVRVDLKIVAVDRGEKTVERTYVTTVTFPK
jgi:hypothetical protein